MTDFSSNVRVLPPQECTSEADARSDEPGYHTILAAFVIKGDSRQAAEEALHQLLPVPTYADGNQLDCWWIAEDERYDRSDNDSAVFCKKGVQGPASRLLEKEGWA